MKRPCIGTNDTLFARQRYDTTFSTIVHTKIGTSMAHGNQTTNKKKGRRKIQSSVNWCDDALYSYDHREKDLLEPQKICSSNKSEL